MNRRVTSASEEREGLPASFLLAVDAPILYRLLQRLVLPGGDIGALFDLGYCVDTGLQVE